MNLLNVKIMKYRIFTLLGLLALGGGSFLQAQDYDDIYYDASKSKPTTTVVTPAKTVAVYGDVAETYKVAAKSNYRDERDVDEYNRRGAYDPSNISYEVDINGDTIYYLGDSISDEAFANTRLIERFYNPDIVILSDDDDLVELYYDESPSVSLIIGSDWGYGSYWSSYYPWYSWGSYYPWYTSYWPYYSYYHWGWGYGYYRPWYYHGPHLWGWSHWSYPYGYWGGPHGWDTWHSKPYWNNGRTGHYHDNYGYRGNNGRVGLATNRNGRGRVDATPTGGRNGISARGTDGNRPTRVGGSATGRGGYATGRGGNMGSRTSNVGTRNSGSVSRSPASNGGSRSYSGGSSSSGRSSGGSYSGGSRSSGGSYSGGSRSSGGSYSGGGGGSRGGSSGGGGGSHGGGGHRR